MYKYIVKGGKPLLGRIRVSGNKNAALPCLAAVLLTDDVVTLKNIPAIEDVFVLINLLKELGCFVERLDEHTYRFQAKKEMKYMLTSPSVRAVRASILFAGPLLARFGKVVLAPPGGDVIGRRRLDTHFLAFESLGAVCRVESDAFYFENPQSRLQGNEIFLDEASVTATENALMAAVLAKGRTVLYNAACEPHVQDLCYLLNSMGAEITGIGSNMLSIEGKSSLHGSEFSIGPDFMEVGSFVSLAASTRSAIEIQGVRVHDLQMIRLGFHKLGVSWQENGDILMVPSEQALVVKNDLGGVIPHIDDAPWPGFPPDLMSIMIVLATQVSGTILFHEKMFESRMFFVDKLISMGARIILCDPHRAVVSGPTSLQPSSLTSPDVRAGMAMLIAALSANGTSEIYNVYQIERGYEKITQRLLDLGADIQRVQV